MSAYNSKCLVLLQLKFLFFTYLLSKEISKQSSTYFQWTFIFAMWQRFWINWTKEEKRDRIYTPNQWIELIKRARHKNLLDVITADQDMFLDFQEHLTAQERKASYMNI